MNQSESPRVESQVANEFARVMVPGQTSDAQRITLKQDEIKNGLGKLVLTIVELLRELLERQAIRRIESGSLTDPEIERLGATFLQLADQMGRLKREFGLDEDDLNIDLGPLGKLL